ncbi:hypothetical protein BSK56_33410, partial [Paenibacillus borealis]
EFFVMQKYRRSGVGTWAAHRLFDMFPGDWKVSQIRANTPARNFWHRVIGSYTGGEFQERFNSWQGNPSQYFSKPGRQGIRRSSPQLCIHRC